MIPMDPAALPAELRPYLQGAPVYDVSGHSAAKTYRIDEGFFLKTATSGSLRSEAAMAAYFHKLGLGAQVLAYCSETGYDYLLTERLPGERACEDAYLEQPERLCEVFAECLWQLHHTPAPDCPCHPLERWLVKACEGDQLCDARLLGGRTPEEELTLLRARQHTFTHNILIQGDACLPNVLLREWAFPGSLTWAARDWAIRMSTSIGPCGPWNTTCILPPMPTGSWIATADSLLTRSACAFAPHWEHFRISTQIHYNL